MSVPNDLRTRALELPLPDRAELAHDLLRSLDPDGLERDPDYEAAWAAELAERMRRFESGESQAIPAEEVLEPMRQRFSRGWQA